MKNSFRIQIPSIIFCYFFIYFFNPVTISTQTIIDKVKDLPVASGEYVDGVKEDWLVNKINLNAGLFRNEGKNELILSNGLISRTFRVSPNGATISIKKLTNQEE